MKTSDKKHQIKLVEKKVDESYEEIMSYYIEINKEFLRERKEAQDSIEILYRKKRKLEKNLVLHFFSKLFQKHQPNSAQEEHA